MWVLSWKGALVAFWRAQSTLVPTVNSLSLYRCGQTPFPDSLLGFPVNVCWLFPGSPVVRFLRHPAALLVASADVKTHTGLEAVGSLFPPACILGFVGKHCHLVVL